MLAVHVLSVLGRSKLDVLRTGISMLGRIDVLSVCLQVYIYVYMYRYV